MSCFSAVPLQIVTFLSVPQEVIFFKHKVFREYAKVAVGPDFIHTLPSFIILATLGIIFLKNPPTIRRLSTFSFLHKIVQISTSWVCINAIFWLWLICQQILYCTTWTYWSLGTEYRELSFPWWHHVWSSYYPPPLTSPTLSSSFISWIICMIFATIFLSCAISMDYMKASITESLNYTQGIFANIKYNWILFWKKLIINEAEFRHEAIEATDRSEWSSVSGDCRSDIGNGDIINDRTSIRPVSYRRNWTPKQKSSTFKEAYSKFSPRTNKSSVNTFTTVPDISGHPNEKTKFSPRQLRHQRGCHV